MANLEEFNRIIGESVSLTDIELDIMIDYSEVLARNLSSIKTHQIRRFFDAIKNIKMSFDESIVLTPEYQAKLLMLRPQFMNAAVKQSGLKVLTEICSKMIGKIKDKGFDKKDIMHFTNFFESLVAFHNVCSNKEKGGKRDEL
ncbi:MAG: type III-A CRISPR-associated protein Csm2 [Nitrospirae bacterium]|nr:type III-A CRISPR-associated protein Csm2 [Nitrospirota bacterium]